MLQGLEEGGARLLMRVSRFAKASLSMTKKKTMIELRDENLQGANESGLKRSNKMTIWKMTI